MTSTQSDQNLLKTDARGRVRVTPKRREALLVEFAQSGLSAARFARLVGVKYSTFAAWVNGSRGTGRGPTRIELQAPEAVNVCSRAAAPFALLEAIVERPAPQAGPGPIAAAGLVVELPGGGRVQIDSPLQLRLAAELLQLLAQGRPRSC